MLSTHVQVTKHAATNTFNDIFIMHHTCTSEATSLTGSIDSVLTSSISGERRKGGTGVRAPKGGGRFILFIKCRTYNMKMQAVIKSMQAKLRKDTVGKPVRGCPLANIRFFPSVRVSFIWRFHVMKLLLIYNR